MKVKGVGAKNTLASIERLHGKEGLARVRQAMSPRLREQTMQLVAVEWYSVDLVAALHVAIRDTLGAGAWDESQRLARDAARVEFNGVYRIFLRATQYDTVWDRMERVWATYYDSGDAKWVDRARGHATAKVRGVSGFNEGMWRSVAGRIEVLLELTGARGNSVTVSTSASSHATIEALWLE